jgi:hypothetical protein
MTTMASFHLNEASRQALRALKGKRWRLATGEPLAEKPRHYFAWNNVVVATDGGDVRIHAGFVERDFEGYDEEYGQLTAHADDKGLAEAQSNGYIVFHHAGEQITEIYIFRVTITQKMHGERTWTLSSDHGVVFGLSGGAAAVCKIGHHTEALDVTFADSVKTLESEDDSTEFDWANELGEEYEVTRELIPVG